MIERSKKLAALYSFAMMVGQNPGFAYILGFLAGQIHRVSFLSDLKGAEVAVKLSIRKTAIWPYDPFKAMVKGVAMPNPYTLVETLNERQDPIAVSLDFDHAEETQWYQEVCLPNVSYIKDPVQAAQEESDSLRKEMDRTLDVYRECKSMLEKSPPEKQKELAFYMRVAEGQLKKLSSSLADLNRKMKETLE